ncbi:MAG TPA: M1 family metallopeptidase, partial [Polyangiaceae bacterium]|nr:M1 family metallopeptidase [Polyangiaceae bacterium]
MPRIHWSTFVLAAPVALLTVSVAAACGGASRHPAETDSLAVKAPERPVTPPTFRLPDDARPLRYDLELALDPSKDTFTGTVGIDLTVQRPTDVVWLNAVGLHVKEAHLAASGQTLPARIVEGHPDFVGFAFERPLQKGTARLVVSYEGPVDRERSRGIYRVSEGSGPDDWYLYTFFEATDARRAFPCFDEPTYKVPWKITLHVKKDHVARANAKIEKEIPGPDEMKTVVFEESKPLPSYLVAFVVGPFDVIDAPPAGHYGTPLRFLVPKGRGGETRYATQATPKFIALLEDYFDMPYPYVKLDVAVVPRFWGTMEHPGIVAVGQPLTLIRPEEETPQRELRYSSIAIHELCHYWFGDYVTMDWWNDTWLNEAFGSWMDAKITQAFEPAWNVERNRLQWRTWAMGADLLESVRRVHEPVDSADGIAKSFDNAITYGKGSLVIRMFEQFVGPEKFRKAMIRYMGERAWKTATAEDLYATLNAELGPPIGAAFRSFMEQKGVPLVSAQPVCAKGSPPALTLSQKRFSSAGTDLEPAQWPIPICVKYGSTKGTGTACTLLTEPSATLALDPSKGCPEWMMLNAKGTGYYRTDASASALRAILDKGWKSLTDSEKIVVVSDMAALIESGGLRLGDALDMVRTLLRPSGHADPFIYQYSLDVVYEVRRDLLGKDAVARYAKFVRTLYGDKTKSLGWRPKPGEDLDTRNLRITLLQTMGTVGDDRALQKEAHALALQWLSNRRAVEADVVEPMLDV